MRALAILAGSLAGLFVSNAHAISVDDKCNYIFAYGSPIKVVMQMESRSGEKRTWERTVTLDEGQQWEIDIDGIGTVTSLTLYVQKGEGWQGFVQGGAEGVQLPVLFCVVRRKQA